MVANSLLYTKQSLGKGKEYRYSPKLREALQREIGALKAKEKWGVALVAGMEENMSDEVIGKLEVAVIEGNIQSAEEWARKVLETKTDPVQAIEDGLLKGIKKVGDDFGKGILFLPELVMGGEACKAGLAILEEEIKKMGRQWKPIGTMVIGTVFGDIHDIGKTLVASFFRASGFKVIDLGVNVPKENFVEAVKVHQPDLLGLSSLLTTTMMEQKHVLEALKEGGLRSKVKVLVGGGQLTPNWAEGIGADGYGENAQEGVLTAKKLLGIR